MSALTIEERLTRLEQEVARLKMKVVDDETPGWKKFVGAFLNDPYFERAMEYGRQYRESQRPKGRTKRKKAGNGDP